MVSETTDLRTDVTDHGGSLGAARARFPQAPEPWLDLSTGINPQAYPLAALPASAFTRLPEEARLADLLAAAAHAYGAPDTRHLVAAPGTQILLPLVAALVPPGRAAVLSPTYAEHRRAAALAGHRVSEVRDAARLADADLAILVNPNNPDGRVVPRADLLRLAARMREKGGLLVVDEAFMDVGPRDASLGRDTAEGGLVVLRSFGKFFGLAGLRLGFAVGTLETVSILRAKLGPWAVSGPALEAGIAALSDLSWQEAERTRLAASAARLDALLDRHCLPVCGGTSLFRFLRTEKARGVAEALGREGILVRAFAEDPRALRFGLPGNDAAFDRLDAALAKWGAGKCR